MVTSMTAIRHGQPGPSGKPGGPTLTWIGGIYIILALGLSVVIISRSVFQEKLHQAETQRTVDNPVWQMNNSLTGFGIEFRPGSNRWVISDTLKYAGHFKQLQIK